MSTMATKGRSGEPHSGARTAAFTAAARLTAPGEKSERRRKMQKLVSFLRRSMQHELSR